MSSTVTLKVSTFTSVYTSGKSDVESGNIIRLFVADKVAPPPDGLTTAQLNQYYLDAATAEVVRYIRQEAARNSLRSQEAQIQAIRDQAVTDTAL